MVNHPKAKHTWVTIRVNRNREIEKVLVVETDLALNESDADFDADALNPLVDAVVEGLKQAPSVDRAEIVRSRGG